MNLIYILLLVLISISISAVTAWIFGTRHPSQVVKDRIGRNSIRSQLTRWYVGHKWICVGVIEDYPAFMGVPARTIILESALERIRLLCSDSSIVLGTEVKLRPRTDDELKCGFWISPVDEFLTPDLREATKGTSSPTKSELCRHQHEVSSPVDTTEVCVHCGDRQPCEPLATHPFPLLSDRNSIFGD